MAVDQSFPIATGRVEERGDIDDYPGFFSLALVIEGWYDCSLRLNFSEVQKQNTMRT